MPRLLLAAMVWLAVASTAAGQLPERSAIVGSVSDSTGAVVQDAEVRLTGTQLIGGARSITTDASGQYRFTGLLPGSYEVAATRQGLRPEVRRGVVLPVDTTYDVNFVLE